jgi:hypothetical protein
MRWVSDRDCAAAVSAMLMTDAAIAMDRMLWKYAIIFTAPEYDFPTITRNTEVII